jgi:hypothetical protein
MLVSKLLSWRRGSRTGGHQMRNLYDFPHLLAKQVLQLVAASRTYARLRQLRGKVRFTRTLAELKADR